jgi:hypothetical protein
MKKVQKSLTKSFISNEKPENGSKNFFRLNVYINSLRILNTNDVKNSLIPTMKEVLEVLNASTYLSAISVR